MNCKVLVALAAMILLAAAPAAAQTPEKVQVERRGFLTEYVLDPEWRPWSIVAPRPDEVWVTLDGPGEIGVLRPETESMVRLGPPEPVRPFLLTQAPDGAVWFTEYEVAVVTPPARLWHVDPATRAFQAFTLPDPQAGPAMIAFDAEGAPWFTQMVAGKVARVQADGSIQELAPAAGGKTERPLPFGLAFDADGRLWVAEVGGERLVAYDRNGESRSYPMPQGFWGPTDVKVDPAGKIWVSGHGTSALASVDPGSGDVLLWPLRPPDDQMSPVARPSGIALDGRGQVWAAEHEGNRIARIIPAENLVVEYPLASQGFKDPLPQWLSVDPAGNVWFASWGTSRVGRIDAGAPYWKVKAAAGSGALSPGGRLAGTAVATPQAGASGQVTWELAGAPYGVTAAFTTAADGSVTFAIDAAPDADPGTYRVLVGVRTDRVLSAQPLTLVIARPLFGIPGLTWTPIAIGGGAMLAAAAVWLLMRRRARTRRAA